MPWGHWLIIYFKKFLILLLWEMKNVIKALIVFFSFPIKTFFNWIVNQCPTTLVNMTLYIYMPFTIKINPPSPPTLFFLENSENQIWIYKKFPYAVYPCNASTIAGSPPRSHRWQLLLCHLIHPLFVAVVSSLSLSLCICLILMFHISRLSLEWCRCVILLQTYYSLLFVHLSIL